MKKVLYIDDANSMRKLVNLVLSPNYQVSLAEDGLEGLKMATASDFDVVLSDINMPKMDGLEFLEKFRQLPNHHFTPILMLTTETNLELKQKGRDLGATGWIVKPFDPEKLGALIERACS